MKNKIANTKDFFSNFKEIWKNQRYRSIIILGLYFFFFLFIIMSLRTGNKNRTYQSLNTDNTFSYSFSKIESNNYHFIYNINLNDTEIVYEGDKYLNKELFIKSNGLLKEQFYKLDDKYLKNINNVWSKTDNPYVFNDFLNILNIKELLKIATSDSKTEFNDKSKMFKYSVSTTSIIKIIEKTNIDISDNPNTITITTDSNNEVVKIELDLSSYIYFKDNNNKNLKINLNYSKFGEIEKIKDPE